MNPLSMYRLGWNEGYHNKNEEPPTGLSMDARHKWYQGYSDGKLRYDEEHTTLTNHEGETPWHSN